MEEVVLFLLIEPISKCVFQHNGLHGSIGGNGEAFVVEPLAHQGEG